MHVMASPLERWFTDHPGPYRHFLAGAGPAAWRGEEVACRAPEGGPAIDWGYGAPEGGDPLRAAVAAAEGLPGSAWVMLTVGASEANFLALMALLGPGDEAVVQAPSYPQLACVAAATGATVVPWPMEPGPGPAVALATLPALLTPRTRLVVVNAPHNPTGRSLEEDDWRALAGLVRAHGRALLLVDEVYRGVGPAAPAPGALAVVGPERLLVTGSASKAWGLPGARVGWLLGDPAVLAKAVRWREHLGLALASPATAWLEGLWPRREEMEEANRRLVGRNLTQVRAWVARQPRLLAELSPRAAACLLGVRGRAPLDDVALAERLYRDDRLLVVPGATLGYPGWLRVGYGHRDARALGEALEVLGAALRTA
ncbi:MAG: pyridoxal phosphate-dependent aminotransferase [Candidatus Sericytochromatia bacterium]|nr:pyridoxal phosphate-dependent aminotransferase [Candidatus Sericytochromatia bacterium]